ncbi:MAG: cytochrome c oxidase assembly protein [Anaerolineae bacterium]
MDRLPVSALLQRLTPPGLWRAWSFQPEVLLPLALASLIYLAGTVRAWRHAGSGRGVRLHRVACFIVAILALVAALLSPLDALSGSLFSAHMVQHLLLMMLAAPLLVMSDFPLALLWVLPAAQRRALGQGWNAAPLLTRSWRAVTSPAGAWLLFALAMWLWHAPAFFQAALRHESIHTLEHLSFLLTAMLFWWVLLRQSGPGHVRYGAAVPYLFTTSLHSSILGALMTFTVQPWYPYYVRSSASWGLTALADQQLAGLIMWIPGGMVFAALTIGYFAAWLHSMDQRHPFSARHDADR